MQTAYNKVERTQQMLKVSQELLALRTESNRVLHEELVRGEALSSQADMATAQELDAEHCFCSHSWTTPRRTTRSFMPWAGHRNRGIDSA